MLWDCKVTPAYCACQERNTIGCISSNDGLGAGVVDLFSTEAVVSGQWSVVGGQWSVSKPRSKTLTTEGTGFRSGQWSVVSFQNLGQKLFTTEGTGFHGVEPSLLVLRFVIFQSELRPWLGWRLRSGWGDLRVRWSGSVVVSRWRLFSGCWKVSFCR